MRVTVVGAGPSGLYLAILMKKADPAHEITVLERNAPDATFGWGVVFSEETLGALRDADYPTYLEITDSFARWTSIDIRYRGQVLRSSGHTFSAIKRTHLLDILQRRARELGVTSRFGVEVSTVEPADLVVAADGANSTLRRAGSFGTTSEPQGCKYVWFGTDLVFDAFTFIFTQTEFGLFQVHAYPFDEHTSTFIVETTEQTWRRAGLDRMSEEDSIAFCSDLFAPELGGHRLMSNKSIWLDFPLVRNEHWHSKTAAGNVVLLGDAAHTAHFSIGSGTKLAMEDAIALANGFVRHPSSVEQALVDYELERQPVVERFQQAAGDSAAYFGRVAHYQHLAPIQFAVNLLTRSGRISHANLTQRDPNLVRVLDAWFAGSTASGAVAAPPMFAPLALGGLTVRNRVVRVGDDEAARAGAGLVLTGLVAVSAEGRTTPDCPVLDDSWAPVVGKVHAAGALAGLRLGHAGRRGAVRGVDVPLRDGWPLLSASPLRYAPFGAVPREMTEADMDRVRAEFVAAAERAAAAGFDVLELDAADGYLLASFLSPLSNRRTDADGTDRLRFPLSVVDAVRAVWPSVLSVRLTATDWSRGGLTVADGIEHARAMAAHGVDLVHVRAGHSTAASRPEYRRGYLTTLSDRIRNEAGVPTLVGGYLTTTDEVNTVVAAGRADLCLFEPPPTPLEKALEKALETAL